MSRTRVVLGRDTTGGPLHPIGVVLAGDALLVGQPHDLVHGAALARARELLQVPNGQRPDPGGSGR